MKTFWITKGLKILLLVTLIAAAMSLAVMLLWNWLLPSLLGAGHINFWEALGVLALSKLLFGFGRGWGGHHHRKHHNYWRHRMQERLKSMTPEQREHFRQEWKSRCGAWKGFTPDNDKPQENASTP